MHISHFVSTRPSPKDRLLAFLKRKGGELRFGDLYRFDRRVLSAEREKLVTELQNEGLVDVYRVEGATGRPTIMVKVLV